MARPAPPTKTEVKTVNASIRTFACVTLALALCPATNGLAAIVCPSSSTLQGVDVSSFQGAVDWVQVAASGRAFAIARVSDGVSHFDPTFASNYAGIKATGMIRGAYQFFEPGQDPVAQANLVLSSIGAIGPGDLPPVLDVEVTGGQSAAAIAAGIQNWVSTIQQGTGRTPIISTNRTFWNGSVASAGFSIDPLWIVAWGITCPNTPTAWSTWVFWMYSGSGLVPGINGNVEMDEFNGSLSDLETLADMSPVGSQDRSWSEVKQLYGGH
jgi:lysozyme